MTAVIQLVVGWVQDFFNFYKAEEFKPVEIVTPEIVTASRRGYNFEHNELKRLMVRLKGFDTIEFTDVKGTAMTPDSIESRFGKDGGIDCVIHIITPTEKGARNVATRIRNILVEGDY